MSLYSFLLFTVRHFFPPTQGLGAMHKGESKECERAREKNILVNFQFGDGDEHVSKIPVFTGKSRGRQRRQRKGM